MLHLQQLFSRRKLVSTLSWTCFNNMHLKKSIECTSFGPRLFKVEPLTWHIVQSSMFWGLVRLTWIDPFLFFRDFVKGGIGTSIISMYFGSKFGIAKEYILIVEEKKIKYYSRALYRHECEHVIQMLNTADHVVAWGVMHDSWRTLCLLKWSTIYRHERVLQIFTSTNNNDANHLLKAQIWVLG